MSSLKNILSITSAALRMTAEDKEKVALKPDANGFYKVPAGALNVYNTSGQFYIGDQDVINIFKNDPDLKRKLEKGALKIEVDHPDTKGYTTLAQYMERLKEIKEINVCGVIGGIDLVELDKYANGSNKKIIQIFIHVKPDGPHAEVLKRKLEDPTLNLAFSLRSFTNDITTPGLPTIKKIINFINFDLINEGGITSAQKWNNIGIEDRTLMTLDISNTTEVKTIKQYLEDSIKNGSNESDKNSKREIITLLDDLSDQSDFSDPAYNL